MWGSAPNQTFKLIKISKIIQFLIDSINFKEDTYGEFMNSSLIKIRKEEIKESYQSSSINSYIYNKCLI